jgi:hypothetical protein
MGTFAAFVAYVQTEVNDTTTRLKTIIERWVNDEHHRIISMRDWDFLVVRKSDSTSIAVAAIPFDIATIKTATITTPAQRILSMCDTTDGNEYPLTFTTIDEIRNNYPSFTTFTGKPEYWYYQNDDKVNVWPALDQTRTFVFEYTKASKTYSTGSTDALLVPDKWIYVLMHKVMERMWKYRTDDRWQFAAADYQEAMKDMIAGCAAKTKIQYAGTGMRASQLPKLSADS